MKDFLFKKKKESCLVIFSVVFVLIFSFIFFGNHNAQAQTQTNSLQPGQFGGFAWSPNIGWIDMSGVSFNADNPNINPVKDISGYAWSPNVGWISFNETDACPISPCKPAINLYGINKTNPFASYGGNSEPLIGWIRVLSMANNNDKEFDSSNGNNVDWADGWINLNGDSYGVGCVALGENVVNSNTSSPKGFCAGYAWGGDVTGWIDFSNVRVGFTQNDLKRINLKSFGNSECGIYNVSPCHMSGSGIHQFSFVWDYGDFVPKIIYPNTITELDTTPGNKCNIYDTFNGITTLAYLLNGSSGPFYLPQASSPNPPNSNITKNLDTGLHTLHMECLKKDDTLAVSNLLYVTVGNSFDIPLPPPAFTVDCDSATKSKVVFPADSTNGINEGYKGKECTGSFINFLGNTFPNNLPFIVENVPQGLYYLKCDIPNKETETAVIEINDICKKRTPKFKEN